jgi:hypothetical protein
MRGSKLWGGAGVLAGVLGVGLLGCDAAKPTTEDQQRLQQEVADPNQALRVDPRVEPLDPAGGGKGATGSLPQPGEPTRRVGEVQTITPEEGVKPEPGMPDSEAVPPEEAMGGSGQPAPEGKPEGQQPRER